MKDTMDLIKELKYPTVSRDIFFIFLGLFLLVILNFLYRPTPEFFPNWVYLTGFQKNILLMILGYFLSRVCNEIGNIVFGFAVAFLSKESYIYKVKKYFNEISLNVINKTATEIKKTRDINQVELNSFINGDNQMHTLFERNIQMIIFERVFLGFSFSLIFLFSPLILIITFIILLKCFDSELNIREYHIEAAKILVENKITKDHE